MSSVCPSVCLSVTLVNHDHTHTHTTGFVRDNPGESGAVTRRNIQPLTPIMVINRLLSASSIYYDPWYLPCSVHVPDSLFQQSLQVFFGLPFGLAPSTSYSAYISSPNHCLLFATHAHTIATYFAVVPRLCHLILVSLSTIYLEFCTTHPSNHSHLCPLKCLLIFLSYGPGLTSMQRTTSQTTTVQSPPHFQWYILIGKQRYQLPEFIPSNLDFVLHSCISISIHREESSQRTTAVYAS